MDDARKQGVLALHEDRLLDPTGFQVRENRLIICWTPNAFGRLRCT